VKKKIQISDKKLSTQRMSPNNFFSRVV